MQEQSPNVQPAEHWRKTLRSLSAKELAPFASENTKKEGRLLILICFIGCLSSLRVISISSISLGFVTAVSRDFQMFLVLVLLVCCYLLIVFVIDVYADWNSRPDNETWLYQNDISAEKKSLEEKFAQVNVEIQELITARQEKNREIKLSIVKENDFEEMTYEEKYAHFQAYRDGTSPVMQKLDEFDEYCRNDGLSGKEEERDNLLRRMNVVVSMATVWLNNLRRIYYLQKVRFWIDAAFPVAFFLITVVLMILGFLRTNMESISM